MKRLRVHKNLILWLLVGFSFIGFLSAGYLTAKYYLGEIPSCSFLGGCDVVAKSKYSQVGPIPLALVGVGYFLALLFLLLAYVDTKKVLFLKLSFVLSAGGFFVALMLLWLQFFVIGAVCFYCLISDFSSVIIFFLLLTKYKKIYGN